MFFEVLDAETSKARSVSPSARTACNGPIDRSFCRKRIIYHIPTFSSGGDHYMVPETLEAGCVRLYKARRFPIRWSCIGALVDARSADPSIVRLHGFWWLFCLRDALSARHASAVLRRDVGRFLRASPEPGYLRGPEACTPCGSADALGRQAVPLCAGLPSPLWNVGPGVRDYRIEPDGLPGIRGAGGPVIGPGGSGWNRAGMHHLDPWPVRDGRWMACVDGLQVD